MRVAIVGGGAAGYFAAINLKKSAPNLNITIYESSLRVLSKVRVAGGGRCNITNSFENVSSLSKVYPRGDKLMKRAFKQFDYTDSYQWFEDNGIKLMVQSDDCVFPQSQDSEEVVNTLTRLATELDIKVETGCYVARVMRNDDVFNLFVKGLGEKAEADIVIVTIGGKPTADGFELLNNLPVEIVPPMPSLFSFNIDNESLCELMGIAVEDCIVALRGTKLKSEGALLITHWGLSGPAILKLSSYGARILNEMGYEATIAVNWCGESDENRVVTYLEQLAANNSKKQLSNIRPYMITTRVWLHILKQAGMSPDRRWGEIGRKGINLIMRYITADEYQIIGKSTHKEEFVTCGGVALSSINISTLESKECQNLFFAGEVLDIDAITGGFNLQAAWSSGYVVADVISKRYGDTIK